MDDKEGLSYTHLQMRMIIPFFSLHLTGSIVIPHADL
jgi:hypothetical protein